MTVTLSTRLSVSSVVNDAPWHPYVFDRERRTFVGDFEGMYRAEERDRFAQRGCTQRQPGSALSDP